MKKVTVTGMDLIEMLSLKDAPTPMKVKNGFMVFSGRMQAAGTVLFNIYGIMQKKKGDKITAMVFVQGGKIGGKGKKIIAKRDFNSDKTAIKYLREVRKFMKFEKKSEDPKKAID